MIVIGWCGDGKLMCWMGVLGVYGGLVTGVSMYGTSYSFTVA